MVRRLLRYLVSDADRRAIEHDLDELYQLRLRHDGPRAVARWLRGQRVLPLHLLADRLRAALPGKTTMQHLGPRPPIHPPQRGPRAGAVRRHRSHRRPRPRRPAAMIGAVWAVLVNPLPYADPDALVWIYTDNPPYKFRFSVVDYRALEADHPTFSAVAAYQTSQVTTTDAPRPSASRRDR